MPSLSDLVAKQPDIVIEALRTHMTEERIARLESVIGQRTRTVAAVVEGLINRGNVSAVMRSAEALGFFKFHIVEGGEKFKNSPRTSQGAEKWLDLKTWSSPKDCVRHLHEAGYAVVVTHLDDTSVPISEIDFTRPTALVFGNEAGGVSSEMVALADQRCIIPMNGFVQSFNISVAAAVALYHAYRDRLARQGFHGDLSDAEQRRLLAKYCAKSVQRAEEILKQKGLIGTYTSFAR